MKVLDRVSTILKQKGTTVWSVAPETTVYEALEIIAEKNIGALLVMQVDQLVGIFSERDYARKVILKGRSSKETTVGEIMNSPAISINDNCTVDQAMQLMTEHRVRHLPVLGQGGSVRGIISIGDLVKFIIESHESTIQQLEEYISGRSDASLPVAVVPGPTGR
jgi:CBS domain-containing protein